MQILNEAVLKNFGALKDQAVPLILKLKQIFNMANELS